MTMKGGGKQSCCSELHICQFPCSLPDSCYAELEQSDSQLFLKASSAFPFLPFTSQEPSVCEDIMLYPRLWVLSLQSCLTLGSLVDCSPPGSSVLGNLQVRILEWIAMPSSRESSQPQDQTRVSFLLPLAPPGSLCPHLHCSIFVQIIWVSLCPWGLGPFAAGFRTFFSFFSNGKVFIDFHLMLFFFF